jgi:hypothetical protein
MLVEKLVYEFVYRQPILEKRTTGWRSAVREWSR